MAGLRYTDSVKIACHVVFSTCAALVASAALASDEEGVAACKAGDYLESSGQTAEAIAASEQAIRSAISADPGDWRAQCALGQVLTRQGRYRAARKALKTSLSLAGASDAKVVWGWLGNLYWRQQRYTRAERAWEKAGDFAPPARVRERIYRQPSDVGIREINHPRTKGPAWLPPNASPAPVPVDG